MKKDVNGSWSDYDICILGRIKRSDLQYELLLFIVNV